MSQRVALNRPLRRTQSLNKASQQTGRAKYGCSGFNDSSRVSRRLS